MLDISQDINSLSDFKRHTSDFVRRMKKTRKPVVLTVNGKAELVVQDAESYQKLLEIAEFQETVAALKEALVDIENGDTVPIEEAFDEIWKKHGLSRQDH